MRPAYSGLLVFWCIVVLGCSRDETLFDATSPDGAFRAEIVASSFLGTYRAELRVLASSPMHETARITLLEARDTREEVTNEITGLKWNGDTLEISVARQRLLYPRGIVTVDARHR
jgi:hypothetical protein